ncbi:MAG: thermonuclease family protein [Aliihoeflea sp.]
MAFIPILLLLLLASPAHGAEIGGPVSARLVRVIDGDTVEADVHVWPGHTVRVSVRLRGIDAPELRSRCAAEKTAARNARDALAGLLASGAFHVRNIDGDKFFGRVVADIETPDGEAIVDHLLAAGLARPYDGKARAPWCG